MKSFRTKDTKGTIRYSNSDGIYHREDGPAVIKTDGYKSWWINGLLHREDGPAKIYSDGDVEYWLKGKRYSKEDWDVVVLKKRLKRLTDL